MSAFNESSDELFTGLLRQSYAGAVRQRLLEIERAVQLGQRHESIVQVLHQKGMKASMGTFRKSLSRARIWWRSQLLMQMATAQSLPGEQGQGSVIPNRSGIVQHVDSTHSQEPGIALTPLQADRGAHASSMRPVMAMGKDRSKTQVQASHHKAAAGVQPVDLDLFFQRKSIFKKT